MPYNTRRTGVTTDGTITPTSGEAIHTPSAANSRTSLSLSIGDLKKKESQENKAEYMRFERISP